MNRIDVLKNFYGSYNENSRLASQHGKVEFLTTIKYIEKYLVPGMKVIEIGAGTGMYSHYIAQQGYQVDAVELTSCNIESFIQNTTPQEKVTIAQGDAIDLSGFKSNEYDITLLLGPMYHLFEEKDKIAALSEAIRVTKKGGIVFVAYCLNEAQILKLGFMYEKFKDNEFKVLINPITFKATYTEKDIFQLYRKEEIDELMSVFSVQRLHYIGTDMATNYIKDCIDAMDESMFNLYLNYHFAICEREDCVGVSHHSLDIFKKIK